MLKFYYGGDLVESLKTCNMLLISAKQVVGMDKQEKKLRYFKRQLRKSRKPGKPIKAKPKSLEEMQGDETLCAYCPLGEDAKNVQGTPNGPIFCEGCCCEEAYDCYRDTFWEEHRHAKK